MALTYSIPGGYAQLSGNQIEIIVTTDELKTKHELAVKVKCDALISLVQIDRKPPVNLSAKFNIQGLVDEPLASQFQYPAVGKVVAYSPLMLFTELEIGEYWEDEAGVEQEAWTVVETPLRVIDGWMTSHERAKLNEQGKSFASEYVNQGKFLTMLPNNLTVSPVQLVKLWMLSRWNENKTVRLNFYYETSDKVGHLPETADLELYRDSVFEFNISPEIFDVQYPLLVNFYRFWLSDPVTGDDLSERRTFLVDQEYYENQVFGFYRNKFSATMSVWFKGAKLTEGNTIGSESAYVPIAGDANTKQPSVKTTANTNARFWEVNVGQIDNRAEILAWREFLTAKERWIVDPDNAEFLIPVRIEGGEFLLYDSTEDLHNASFKLIEAHQL